MPALDGVAEQLEVNIGVCFLQIWKMANWLSGCFGERSLINRQNLECRMWEACWLYSRETWPRDGEPRDRQEPITSTNTSNKSPTRPTCLKRVSCWVLVTSSCMRVINSHLHYSPQTVTTLIHVDSIKNSWNGSEFSVSFRAASYLGSAASPGYTESRTLW